MRPWSKSICCPRVCSSILSALAAHYALICRTAWISPWLGAILSMMRTHCINDFASKGTPSSIFCDALNNSVSLLNNHINARILMGTLPDEVDALIGNASRLTVVTWPPGPLCLTSIMPAFPTCRILLIAPFRSRVPTPTTSYQSAAYGSMQRVRTQLPLGASLVPLRSCPSKRARAVHRPTLPPWLLIAAPRQPISVVPVP